MINVYSQHQYPIEHLTEELSRLEDYIFKMGGGEAICCLTSMARIVTNFEMKTGQLAQLVLFRQMNTMPKFAAAGYTQQLLA